MNDMTDEMILVPRAELLAWAKAWLEDCGPNDGTDCVTPFDTYLLKSPTEAQAQGGGEVVEPMTGDLLPCPFCGRSNQDRWPCEWLDDTGANVIRCAWCHGAAPASAWNRRTAPPSAPVGVEAQGGGKPYCYALAGMREIVTGEVNFLCNRERQTDADIPLYTAPPSAPVGVFPDCEPPVGYRVEQHASGNWLYAVGDHASADYWSSRTRAVFKAWEHRERQLLRLAQQPAAVDGAIDAALSFLGGLQAVGNAKAGEIARGLRALAQQPADMASVYQCPRCATSLEVDPTAKPAAVDGDDFDCPHSAFDNCDCYADQQGGSDNDR